MNKRIGYIWEDVLNNAPPTINQIKNVTKDRLVIASFINMDLRESVIDRNIEDKLKDFLWKLYMKED